MKTHRIIPALLATAVSAFVSQAFAHEAPTGWSYPASCCHNRDCRPVPAATVKEGPDGYRITISHETLPYGDTRVKNSPDGLYHWCTSNGSDSGPTICLYVPPRAY